MLGRDIQDGQFVGGDGRVCMCVCVLETTEIKTGHMGRIEPTTSRIMDLRDRRYCDWGITPYKMIGGMGNPSIILYRSQVE